VSKNFPLLSKAPITLAILEIRYETDNTITNESLKLAKSNLKDGFPVHNFTTDAQFELRPEPLKTTLQLKSSHISGNIFMSSSRKHEILLSTKNFNFKQHGLYSNWNDFRDTAMDAWEKCLPVIKPQSISWLSLRYINNIEIPLSGAGSIPAETLFKTFVANEGSSKFQSIATYALRYTHVLDNAITVHFGQELLQGPIGILPFIVDIDVIHSKPYGMGQINLQEKFEELRNIKNEYFFDNLTDKTLELLK